MNTTAAPPTARLARRTRCQSEAKPSTLEYWHMGETTMRLDSCYTAIPVRGSKRFAISSKLFSMKSHSDFGCNAGLQAIISESYFKAATISPVWRRTLKRGSCSTRQLRLRRTRSIFFVFPETRLLYLPHGDTSPAGLGEDEGKAGHEPKLQFGLSAVRARPAPSRRPDRARCISSAMRLCS